ncbi:pentatricopeptide repeat-containing protein At1g52640, mitochondrial-like [Nymphaea colorata]|uniref:Pentacotripeptide-repeat region of PRORP domain-containing protein n=1 Tax=Nymphaea colorata TaxID=210225 RepID=A0A5K1E551_9MAGN|nr:pentatricopeptide repeat-containing protein At1g52640, mitochondrial-like [Nymphaea colorata]
MLSIAGRLLSRGRSSGVPFRLLFGRQVLLRTIPPLSIPSLRFFSFKSLPEAHFSWEIGVSPLPENVRAVSLEESVNDICRILSDFRQPHHDLESALDGLPSNISPEMVEDSLKKCSNLATPCFRFFLWASRSRNVTHSRASYHIIVDILGAAKQFPLIWDLLLQMKTSGYCEPTNDIFWVVFRSYARALLPGDAIRAFRRMSDFGIMPTAADLDELLFSLCKNDLVNQAQEFFDEVKPEFPVNPKPYTILISGWGEIGNYRESQRLFDELIDRNGVVDVAAYNALLGSLCKSGKIDEAHRAFQDMGRFGLVPDVCSYSVFVRAHCDSGDIDSATRVFDRMRRYGFIPNVFTYNSMIKALCRNQSVDDAYAILDEMVGNGLNPDTWSYNSILAVHCELREVNRALRLLKRMDKESCNPDRHTYNMLLKLLIVVGRFDRAFEVWDGMEKRGFYPSVATYSVMIHGLCKKRKIEDACRFFELMIDEGIPPYTSTCEVLRNLLLEQGLRDKVYILLGKMQRSSSCSIQELSSIMDSPSTAYRSAAQPKKPSKARPRSSRKKNQEVVSHKVYPRSAF